MARHLHADFSDFSDFSAFSAVSGSYVRDSSFGYGFSNEPLYLGAGLKIPAALPCCSGHKHFDKVVLIYRKQNTVCCVLFARAELK